MKDVSFALLALRWRARACQWWRLWEAQGGMRSSLRRQPLSRLACTAEAVALECSRLAEFFRALDDAYPLGVTWVKPKREVAS